jgi:hypothetical protein
VEWIDFCKASLELWRQNGITNTQDRVTNISTILHGDLLTGFEETIQELTTSTSQDRETEMMEITDKTLSASLNAVAQMMFPFRALETQKQWMQCCMQKPKELSIQKTVAGIERLNNSLPLFPNDKEAGKFTPGQILEILEWSIPKAWRTKLDLDRYVPTEFTKERFMTECEATEQKSQKLLLRAII